MALDLIQQSFSAGEWSSELGERSDLEKYYSACRLLENMFPTRYGPAQRRPGLKFVAEVKDSSKKTRLIPFKFSTIQAYMLEYGDEYIRFFKDRAQITEVEGTEDISALDNIIAHWLCNETEGVTVADDDGGTHDGTASVSTDTLHTTGKVGTGSFDLDGQYDVTIPEEGHNLAIPDFSFTDDSDDSAFSIAIWGSVTQQNDLQVLLSKWKDIGATSEWRLSLSADLKLQLHLTDTSSNLTSLAVSQWKLNDNEVGVDKVVVDTIALQNGEASSTNTNVLTATSLAAMTPCFDLDGQYAVEIADNAAYSFGDGSNDSAFSLAAWVFVVNTGVRQEILTKYDSTTGSFAREWRLNISSGNLVGFSIYDESANARRTITVDDTLSTGWHFLVATYNGVGGNSAEDGMKIYVDRVLVSQTASTSGTYVAMENFTTKVVIGSFYDSSGSLGSFWNAKIDNAIIFDVELSDSQISTLYNGGDGTEDLGGSSPTPFAVTDDAVDIGWHFFAATYSAPSVGAPGDPSPTAADGIILYVDGVAVDSTATNSVDYIAMQGGAEEVRIGSQRNTGDTANEKYWGDKVDEISIFGDVLAPTEVASLFTAIPYEIESPYLEDDLFGIQRIQSADLLYNFHGNYNVQTLTRFGHALWELDSVVFDWPAFMSENKTTTTITPSGKVGTIELTATSAIFTSGHVGSSWLIRHNRTDNHIEKQLTDIATLIVLGDAADSYAAEGVTDILVDVLGSYRLRTDSTTGNVWIGTVLLERSYDGILELVLDAAPAGGIWSVDDIITGSTSGNTCVIVTAIDTTHYKIKQLSGSFTDGEILTNQSGNARNTAATWPRFQGWHTLETFQSAGNQDFNAVGEETVGDAYLRARRTVDNAGNDPTVTLSCERFYHYGIVKITGFSSSTSVTGTVTRNIGSTDATELWSEGSWSEERGYPSAGTFHEERLMLAGTTSNPNVLNGSKTDDWHNFRTGTLADDSVSYRLSSNEVNAIRWLISKEILLMGTSGAEWKLGAFDTGEPLTPDNPTVPRVQTTYGSKEIQAIMLANIVLFVQQEGTVVRGSQFVFDRGEAGAYDAFDYTTLAEHITASGIVSMAYQQNPSPVLWCVLANGFLIGMTFEPGEKVWGWFRVVTDGLFEDVAVIPGVSEDEIWCIVNRTIGGATKRYIEYFTPRDWGDIEDMFFVDSGLSFDGGDPVTITSISNAAPCVVTAANTFSHGNQIKIADVGGMIELNNKIFTVKNPSTSSFTLRDKLDEVDIDSTGFGTYTSDGTAQQVDNKFLGLDHLEGKTVSVLGDGSVHPDVVVASGKVTLTDYYNKVHIGLPYTSKLQPMKIVVQTGEGSSSGKKKKISKLTFSFKDTVGCSFGTNDGADVIDKVIFRKNTDTAGEAVPLFTGEKQQTFTGGYDLTGDIFVKQDQPLPLTLRSITAQIGIFD